MSAVLEQRYRRALRWYPRRWRQRNADAAIGTLLELAHEDGRSAPATGELANLRLSGLGARIGFAERMVPATVRDRAAPVALALGAAIAVGGVLSERADAERLLGYPASLVSGVLVAGPFANLGVVFYAAWIVALVFASIGMRRAAKIALLVSLPASILAPKASEWSHYFLHPLAGTVGWLDLLALIALAGSLRYSGSRRLLLASFGAFAVAFAAVYAVQVEQQWGVFPRVDWYLTGFAQVLVFPGILLSIVVAVILWRRTRSPWAPAILILTAPLLPLAWLDMTRNTAWLEGDSSIVTVTVLIAATIALLALFGVRPTLRKTR